MALGQATRTIRDYLGAIGKGATGSWDCAHPLGLGLEDGRNQFSDLLLAQLLDLTSSSNLTEQVPSSGRAWTFAYKECRGVQAEAASALLSLWVTLEATTRHPCTPAHQQILLRGTMDCLSGLIRGNPSFRHLLFRVWQEKSRGCRPSVPCVSMQMFCLQTYAQWSSVGVPRRGASNFPDHHPLPRSLLASLLHFWSLLAQQQLLQIEAAEYRLLYSCLVGPVYRAAASPAPLSPVRRRGSKAKATTTLRNMEHDENGRADGDPSEHDREKRGGQAGEEDGDVVPPPAGNKEDPNVLLLPSMHLLAHAARGSPSFRSFLQASDHHEEHLLLDSLLSLVVSAQREPSGTQDMVLATLGMLSRLVAGKSGMEHKVFDRKNVQESTEMIYSCLLPPNGTGALGSEDVLSAAVDVWSDLLASPWVVSILEEGDGLPSFVTRALTTIGCMVEQAREDGAFSGRIEALIRALRVMFQGSSVGRRCVVEYLFAKRENESGATPCLVCLVRVALSRHTAAAAQAASFLERVMSNDPDEEVDGRWRVLSLVLLTPVREACEQPGSRTCRAKSSHLPPESLLVCQENIPRSGKPDVDARHQNASGPSSGTLTGDLLVDRLAHALQTVAEEAEVCCEGGIAEGLTAKRPSFHVTGLLELEWHLRHLLSFAWWLANAPTLPLAPDDSHASSTTRSTAPGVLGRELVRRISARVLGCIVVAWAHTCFVDEWEGSDLASAQNGRNRGAGVQSSQAQTRLLPPSLVQSPLAVGSLEVVVIGCRLLVTIVNGEKEGALQPWSLNRTAFAEACDPWRWPYILTTSPQISNVLAAALHQGLDRSLLSHLMGLLASIQAEAGQLGDGGGDGLEWRVIVDSLVRQNHRTRLSSRLAKKEVAELQMECATLRRDLKAKTREAEMAESQRAALQAKHDREIESVGQDWREEVLSLREAAEIREAEQASELKACVTENDLWEAKAREAEKRLDQAMQSHRQVESENASLKEEMRVLIFKLVQVEEVNATREDERRTWAEKFEEQQLAAAENDQRTAAAELALQSANSQLKKAASKLTVLAKAIQAKDEAARRADDRFEKLEKHISDIERDLVILRGRLVEVEGENRRLKALRQVETTERKREVQADKEEMERASEMVESLRDLVRAQMEKIMELQYERKQLLVNLKEKDGRLLQQVEALRRQHHAAAVIKSLAVPLEEAEDRMASQDKCAYR